MNDQTSMTMSRRDFLRLSSLAVAGMATGCATNPVTGQSQLMLLSESSEISIDKKNSPHQFSADYGAIADPALNRYISDIGNRLAAVSHRPQMPYSFRGVNAVYANAYAFPGGSIAATRGLLLLLENEAELAGLMGHEIAHVNARHTATRMSKGILLAALVQGATVYAGTQDDVLKDVVSGLGGIGAGVLLAKYSRDDEHQADALGMEYMVKGGWNPKGMPGLMKVLMSLSKHKPNLIEQMFSSHPMSDERYNRANDAIFIQYESQAKSGKLGKERHMDHTAGLRKIKGAIESMQEGEKEMAKKNYAAAETRYQTALKIAPNDYAGLLMMSKCKLAQKKSDQARQYAEKAKAINPTEPQAFQMAGMSKLAAGKFQSAYAEFSSYEAMLPGNANTIFLKARSLEGMGNINRAGGEYRRFLENVQSGGQAEYAYRRLINWGLIKN